MPAVISRKSNNNLVAYTLGPAGSGTDIEWSADQPGSIGEDDYAPVILTDGRHVQIVGTVIIDYAGEEFDIHLPPELRPARPFWGMPVLVYDASADDWRAQPIGTLDILPDGRLGVTHYVNLAPGDQIAFSNVWLRA